MTELSAYVLEPIREDPDFTLYRGRQHGNPSRVLAVALTTERPSPQALRRLEHEYSLAAELDSAWAAKPLALARHEGRTILILTDPGGEPLDRILERGQLLDLTSVLRIAIGLATALGQVHRRGLIHKDLKPGNVLVDDAGKVWLTGFAIASRLPHERQAPAPPEIIAGTLAYMAPEQTGRMNRSIDTRTDLYSLGVTLYQMLTGALPFTAADPLEWIHCHIARRPAPPGDLVALPEPVSSLTMKLLAKNAEDRYQTAEGLEADLRRCLTEWDSLHRIDPFPLGAHDSSDRLLIPEKLYGREPEIETLLTAFDRVVARGTPEVVLVSGYSGVGKSSVVNELHKALVPPRGLFAAGKFDQYKRDIPYTTLAQAFQTLMRQILVKSEAELDQWRSALREAVEPNGQLIVNLIPELEFIIGKQFPLPEIPPQDAQNRFLVVLFRFLNVFARQEHRLEGRDSDTMRLYEQAIHLARENGFIQNEALANELAARFYAAQGLETAAHAYLRSARNCYDRWGAHGKVRQLDALHPRLHEERTSASLTATIGTPVAQLDVETVVKASQALSSEIVLPKLIERLMRIAVEHAGAERGLLILLRGDEPQIEAEATTGHGRAVVTVRRTAVTPSDLPHSALHYVIRTRERVLLDDASVGNLYSEDEYVRQRRPRSVLCVPIVKQTKLVGALYLENTLTPHVFTSDRVTVLELLASQAAISLENANLYSDLQRSEAFLAEGQSISHTGSFGWSVANGEIYWSAEAYNIVEHDRAVTPTLEMILRRIHPNDRDLVKQTLDRACEAKADFDLEHRLVMPDGSVKHLRVLARALTTSSGNLEFVGAVTDVTAARQAEEALRASEADLLEAQRLSHTGSWKHDIASGRVTVSPEVYRVYGVRPDEVQSNTEFWLNRNHPDDAKRIQELFEKCELQKVDYEADYRIVLPDGAVKHLHAIGHPTVNEKGGLVEFVGTVIDVTAAKQAEEKIRQSQSELRQILELVPQHVYVLSGDPDRTLLYANQAALDYLGLTFEESRTYDRRRMSHPDDYERVMTEAQGKFSSGLPYETELRLLRYDGKYRWFLYRWNPIRDDQGRLTRWYVAGTDIEDRKQTEQRLQNENVALREEIDKASMFEQIVGTSAPLQMVLARISKVAPTDSSVLITGETGTGKELVARAIHRRSQRSSRAFVSVNCAAIPRDLIASELFGHEKGAFTGATQRRLGRFELAEGGTIFLDEVGELPAETQIALLRVLQEHEFERVGGTGSMRTNVRVIAATNRDLEAGIAAGVFRSDLFYRLNVFPIEVPPLRERRQDIPVLVEYFIDRYARKAGKSFQTVNKMSLDLLQSYSWPGNIRELQNVIERSVIVCETETFSVDESWLSRRSSATEPKVRFDFSQKLAAQEKEMIEAALRETKGRVFGPSGAAAKLGMPGTTLDSKIKSLKINKNRFKSA